MRKVIPAMSLLHRKVARVRNHVQMQMLLTEVNSMLMTRP